MIIVTKKSREKLESKIDKKINVELEKITSVFEKNQKSSEDFSYRLLSEKSELEKQLSKEKTLRELAEDKIAVIEKLEKQLQEEIMMLKAEKKISASSLGGLRSKNNNLQKELGKQEQYISFLIKQLEKVKIPTPTLKQLLEYEHTRKSPINHHDQKNIVGKSAE